jgi:hypothetical protein
MQKSIMPILSLVLLLLSSSLLIDMETVKAASSLSENSWVTKASMNVARSNVGVASVNGKIYAIGGISVPSVLDTHHTLPVFTEAKIVDKNEQYDPITNTWSTKAQMPIARANFAIASFENEVFCIGGTSGSATVPVNEVYYPANGSWASKAPLPAPEEGMQAEVLNGKIYLIGGQNYAYDPTTDNWTTLAPMPTAPNGSFCSCVYNSEIYVLGSPCIQIYNTENQSWRVGTQIPVRMTQPIALATSGLDAPARIYVFDGSIVASYDPQTNSWKAGAVLPAVQTNPGDVGKVIADHQGYGITVADDLIYVIGGESVTVSKEYINSSAYPEDTAELALNQQYIPFGYNSVSPQISIISPSNMNYTSDSIPLTFVVNKNLSWIGYSLDGQQNVDLPGNSTITNLAYGSHNIIIYANDSFGNVGVSETINFHVENPATSAPISLPLSLTIIVVPVLIVCIAVSLLYAKKHKSKR